jgi:hypothetical protein
MSITDQQEYDATNDLKNTSLNSVVGHNKIMKLLLAILKTKHNALILQGYIMSITDQQEYDATNDLNELNRLYITQHVHSTILLKIKDTPY